MAQPEWTKRSQLVSLGKLPSFLDDARQESAAQQLNAGYAFAGGWRPQSGFTLEAGNLLTYPGDPPMRPIAETRLRGETICFYPYSYVAVIQPDMSFEVCRMD